MSSKPEGGKNFIALIQSSDDPSLLRSDPSFDVGTARHHGSTKIKTGWIFLAFLVWLILYTVPIIHEASEPIDCRGTLKLVGFPADLFQSYNISFSAVFRRTLADIAGNGVRVGDAEIVSITADRDNSLVEFRISSQFWQDHCFKNETDADDCDASDISYNIYFALGDQSDRFSITFIRLCCQSGISALLPATFIGTQMVGAIEPGLTSYNVEDIQKCLALLALAITLWASEAIPLWVTSLLIPLMTVVCRIQLTRTINGELSPISAVDAASAQLACLANSNVILLMGGFSIAAALHKFQIDTRVALKILSQASEPRLFILLNMLVAFVASMFCNNIAASILCFFIIVPVIYFYFYL